MFNIITAAAIAAASLTNPGSTSWICDTLEASPNTAGVVAVIQEMIADGYTSDNGGPELLVSTVLNQCPEYLIVVKNAAEELS